MEKETGINPNKNPVIWSFHSISISVWSRMLDPQNRTQTWDTYSRNVLVEETSWSKQKTWWMKTWDWIWIKCRDTGRTDTETQTAVEWACGADEQHQITSKSIDNVSIGYKKRGKTEEKMDRQCERGSVSKRKRCISQVVECVKDGKRWREFVCAWRHIVSNLWVKMDSSKNERRLVPIKHD